MEFLDINMIDVLLDDFFHSSCIVRDRIFSTVPGLFVLGTNSFSLLVKVKIPIHISKHPPQFRISELEVTNLHF